MAIRLNKVFVAGNLTRDPQVRFLANEKAVANFGLAVNRSFRTADGDNREEVAFLDIEAWGRTAELCGQYLTKGRGCVVEGRLKMDSWEDKDGNKRNKIVIVAENVQFLGGRGEGGDGGDEAGGSESSSYQSPSSAPRRASAPAPGPVGADADDEPPF